MSYSIALSSDLHLQAEKHLLRHRGVQEDLCFGLYRLSQGRERTTALVERLVLPQDDERAVHGNASFMPHYFERALAEARAAGAGLVLMHSHIGPGWQGMSPDDVEAELGIAPATFGATELPLVGMTMGTDGAWSARFWSRVGPRQYDGHWCRSVRVVGTRLAVTWMDRLAPRPDPGPELERTVSAWGSEVQANVARLKVGIVGLGSVGQIVAVSLAKMGIQNLLGMDFDSIEVVNLDRLLFGTRDDVGLAKVHVTAAGLRPRATAHNFTFEALEWSAVEPEGFAALLDCDVVFSCVDRPWPRSVLNFLAYAHLVPVIDGGVAIERHASGQGMRRADWRAHVVGPGHKCLECLGQYTPDLVSLEQEGFLDDPSYIAGLPDDHPAKRRENVFPFGQAAGSMEVLQFLALVADIRGMALPGAQMYHFVPGRLDTDPNGCLETCLYPGLIASGDSTGIEVTGHHRIAEQTRSQRTVGQTNTGSSLSGTRPGP